MSRTFPDLSDLEREALRWLLPASRPGYDAYYRDLEALPLLGTGRWGAGDRLFGPSGSAIDVSGPMERVFATGIIELNAGRITISVHEKASDQIEVQFGSPSPDFIPGDASEVRRYCWSYWSPGEPAPASGVRPREATLPGSAGGDAWVLAISPEDERIWMHHAADGVNHLIPLTSFHAELMRHLAVRDAETALQPRRLFTRLGDYADRDLIEAFKRYNMRSMKLPLPTAIVESAAGRPSWFARRFRR